MSSGRVYSWVLWSLASSFCPLRGRVQEGVSWRVGDLRGDGARELSAPLLLLQRSATISPGRQDFCAKILG